MSIGAQLSMYCGPDLSTNPFKVTSMNFVAHDLMLAACRQRHELPKHTLDPPPPRRNRSERRAEQAHAEPDRGRSKHSVVGGLGRAFRHI